MSSLKQSNDKFINGLYISESISSFKLKDSYVITCKQSSSFYQGNNYNFSFRYYSDPTLKEYLDKSYPIHNIKTRKESHLEIYMSGSAFNNSNKNGKLIQEYHFIDQGKEISENESFTFIPDNDGYGQIILKINSGNWYFTNIEILSIIEKGFNSNNYSFDIPLIKLNDAGISYNSGQSYSFQMRFFDINNNESLQNPIYNKSFDISEGQVTKSFDNILIGDIDGNQYIYYNKNRKIFDVEGVQIRVGSEIGEWTTYENDDEIGLRSNESNRDSKRIYLIGSSSEYGGVISSSNFLLTAEGKPSGSFTGSFSGDGSGLINLIAEWDGTHVGMGEITGSLTLSGSGNLIISGSGDEDFFIIKSGSENFESIKINNEGLFILGKFNKIPDVQEGGIYYNSLDNKFYLGEGE